MGRSYQEVQKGMCEAEFKAFKECVQVCPWNGSTRGTDDRNRLVGNGELDRIESKQLYNTITVIDIITFITIIMHRI